MMQETPYELFRQYLHGETDADQNRKLMEWLLESEENRRTFTDTVLVICAAEVTHDENFEKRRKAFMGRLSEELDREDAQEAAKKHLRKRFLPLVGAAAVILAFAALHFFVPSGEPASMDPRTCISYTNTKGDADIFSLPDGSTVWVKDGSSLQYDLKPTTDGAERVVLLQGEAFFDVVKDSLHPFVVKTDNLSIVALGTRFNVRSSASGETEVMLEEGSVRLKNLQGVNLMRLQPNQAATLHGKDGDITIEQCYVLAEVRLKYNVIALTDATAEEIAEAIGNAYGVRVKARNMPDGNRRYNFSCLKSRGAEEAASILSHLTGARYRIGEE